MLLYLTGHTYKYECEKVCRIFFPTEKIIFAGDDRDFGDDTKSVFAEIKENGEKLVFLCKAVIDGKEDIDRSEEELSALPEDGDREKAIARVMVTVLSRITGIIPPWGILTGVRPSKLMRKYIAETGKDKAISVFTDSLKVLPEKARLAANVAEAENAGIALSKPNSFSLYISIPFCPTRCSYCSFVSHSIENAKKLIPDYVKLLCDEICKTAEIAKELNLRLETVYIGGGTPTSLDANSLKKICSAINTYFDMKTVREFTVEAGRPDTIDSEKLNVLKNAGVDRISINPQTFSDRVLENIGRKHTGEEILQKFSLAKETGFDNINMDLIAGLPGDTPEGFKRSLDKAISLSPANITVHTLALKSSASLVTAEKTDSVCKDTEEMIDYASTALYSAGYLPYYMYRQSKSVGNLENVGWCKPDKACLYNIYMMEEIHTVLACGGGAVSKLKVPDEPVIERIYNFKYPYEYISRFDELIKRKDGIKDFYGKIKT